MSWRGRDLWRLWFFELENESVGQKPACKARLSSVITRVAQEVSRLHEAETCRLDFLADDLLLDAVQTGRGRHTRSRWRLVIRDHIQTARLQRLKHGGVQLAAVFLGGDHVVVREEQRDEVEVPSLGRERSLELEVHPNHVVIRFPLEPLGPG